MSSGPTILISILFPQRKTTIVWREFGPIKAAVSHEELCLALRIPRAYVAWSQLSASC